MSEGHMPDLIDPPKTPPPAFDPFPAPAAKPGSVSWMQATVVQALLTTALLALSKKVEGSAYERHVQFILLIGIVATWSLALRTIRERMVELMRYWHNASKGLLRRASRSGLHMIAVKLSPGQETHIKGSIWRLRIIAAGLTIPFIIMPMCWSLISVVLSMRATTIPAKDTWAISAVFTMLGTLIAAGYLHWVMMPRPAPLRVSSLRRGFPHRRRKF
jgi:hypothetical protein